VSRSQSSLVLALIRTSAILKRRRLEELAGNGDDPRLDPRNSEIVSKQ